MDIFIHTEKNVLIHVNPCTKIPRTYERFARLIGKSKFLSMRLINISSTPHEVED